MTVNYLQFNAIAGKSVIYISFPSLSFYTTVRRRTEVTSDWKIVDKRMYTPTNRKSFVTSSGGSFTSMLVSKNPTNTKYKLKKST